MLKGPVPLVYSPSPLPCFGLAGPGLGAVVVVAARFPRCRRILPKRDEGEKFRRRLGEGGRHMSASLPLAASPVMAAQDEQRTRGRRRRMMSCCPVRTHMKNITLQLH